MSQRYVQNSSGRGGFSRMSGFTIVELVVASTVMSVVLLGAYSVFRQVIFTEKTLSNRWSEQAAAWKVANHFAEVFENLTVIAEIPTLTSEVNDLNDRRSVTCTLLVAAGDMSTRPVFEQRKYLWNSNLDGGVGSVECRTRYYSGQVEITPGALASGDNIDEDERWNSLDSQDIRMYASALEIEFQRLDEANSTWLNIWDDSAKSVKIKVRVRVGDHIAERIIVPKYNM